MASLGRKFPPPHPTTQINGTYVVMTIIVTVVPTVLSDNMLMFKKNASTFQLEGGGGGRGALLLKGIGLTFSRPMTSNIHIVPCCKFEISQSLRTLHKCYVSQVIQATFSVIF